MYKPINERNVYNIFTQKLLTRDHLYCYNRRAVMCVCVEESECIENTKPDFFFYGSPQFAGGSSEHICT